MDSVYSCEVIHVRIPKYRRSLLFVSLLSCKTYKLSYVREKGNKVDSNEKLSVIIFINNTK